MINYFQILLKVKFLAFELFLVDNDSMVCANMRCLGWVQYRMFLGEPNWFIDMLRVMNYSICVRLFWC